MLIDPRGYCILALVHESSTTLVFRAERERDKRPVVLKVLKPEAATPAALATYRHEHDMLHSLRIAGVIEIAGMFVISAGLSRTGVAELLGRWLVKVAGASEMRILTAVTLASGILSGFINNLAVAALLLPVVITVARQVGVAPSRLLIPMAIAVQVGGFLTLIGSFPNLLAADALRAAQAAEGIELIDTPEGVKWRRAG